MGHTPPTRYCLPSNLVVVSHVAVCKSRPHVAVVIEGVPCVTVLAADRRGDRWEFADVAVVEVGGSMELLLLLAFLPSGQLLVGGSSGQGCIQLSFATYDFLEGRS